MPPHQLFTVPSLHALLTSAPSVRRLVTCRAEAATPASQSGLGIRPGQIDEAVPGRVLLSVSPFQILPSNLATMWSRPSVRTPFPGCQALRSEWPHPARVSPGVATCSGSSPTARVKNRPLACATPDLTRAS
uniref:Uncharacterized protein n=1 Tax=Molossus molossus TaxID=27622 RepID=A0A7J8GRT2_MOLMO|nr:hypothetical protein HJG59_011386 [Molossus molossus]